ncbi:hypothetical protein AAG570_013071 [Ranatra chinensis]|uniref:Deacetylase sirtuin-type domain-containing protein n=1 Tax=Ranatra chinensis TaxID=642074 RepID=A0ABD0Z1Y2_9HEMI
MFHALKRSATCPPSNIISCRLSDLSCVPKHEPCRLPDLEALKDFLSNYRRPLVLTGAGASTESGIPDYRSEGIGLYATSSSRPVLIKDFLRDENIRRRYWARNYAGWPLFSRRLPNETHLCLSRLQAVQKVGTIVTQNVDNLHQKAKSRDVIELHGTAFKVVCTNCSYSLPRQDFQAILENMNPHITAPAVMRINPDGDSEVLQEIIKDFVVPNCPKCGGIIKPDIVFYGDNVPKTRINLVRDKVVQSDGLIVFGSSLQVFSSYRIVLQASDIKKPIAIINIGRTRCDELCNIKINARCGEILTQYCNLLQLNI